MGIFAFPLQLHLEFIQAIALSLSVITLQLFEISRKDTVISTLRLFQEYSKLVNYPLRAKLIAPISSRDRNIWCMVPFTLVKI